MKPVLALAVLVIFALAIVILRGRQHFASQGADKLAQAMSALAAEAAREAQSKYGFHLDYSPDSVQLVEKILSMLHADHARTPFSEDRLSDEAHRWGAYIGRVVKSLKSARWEHDSRHAGKGALPLIYDTDAECYPCAWCYRRIKDGPEDNVWHKFQIIFVADEDRGITIYPDDDASNTDAGPDGR